MIFKPSTRNCSAYRGYHVYLGDERLGLVERRERWTVRGTYVSWVAYAPGRKCIGTEASRKAAANLLAN